MCQRATSSPATDPANCELDPLSSCFLSWCDGDSGLPSCSECGTFPVAQALHATVGEIALATTFVLASPFALLILFELCSHAPGVTYAER